MRTTRQVPGVMNVHSAFRATRTARTTALTSSSAVSGTACDWRIGHRVVTASANACPTTKATAATAARGATRGTPIAQTRARMHRSAAMGSESTSCDKTELAAAPAHRSTLATLAKRARRGTDRTRSAWTLARWSPCLVAATHTTSPEFRRTAHATAAEGSPDPGAIAARTALDRIRCATTTARTRSRAATDLQQTSLPRLRAAFASACPNTPVGSATAAQRGTQTILHAPTTAATSP